MSLIIYYTEMCKKSKSHKSSVFASLPEILSGEPRERNEKKQIAITSLQICNTFDFVSFLFFFSVFFCNFVELKEADCNRLSANL